MSTVKTNNVQIGQSVTATNNFVLYQPSSPDGTVRLGNGNAGSVTDLVTVNSSGNVGVGTSSPSYKLDVYTGAAGVVQRWNTGSVSMLVEADHSGNGNWYLSPQGSQNFNIKTGGSTRLTLDSSGNLGIGTSSPAQKLDVVGYANITNATAGLSGTARGTLRLYDSSSMASGVGAGVAFLGQATTGSSAYTTAGSVQAYKVNGTSGNDAFGLQFTTRSNGNGCATVMTLDDSGNLGLGVAPSASTLKQFEFVSAGNVLTSGGANDIRLGANWTYNSGYKYSTTAAASLYQQSFGVHYWYTAASGTAGNAISFTQAMTLDASGNLLVGLTSSLAKFVVRQSANSVNTRIDNDVTSYTSTNLWSTFTSSGNNNTTAIHFAAYTGVNVCVIYGNGNIQNTNNSYGSLSDVKIKENIVDASPKLQDLCKVKVRNFNLKSNPDQKQIGVVAQELEKVFPGMVEEVPDRDENGDDLGTTTKSVKYSVFVPMLVKAIQELSAELNELKKRIN